MVPGRYATTIAFIGTAIIFGAYHYRLGGAGLLNALIVGAVYLGLFLFNKRNLWYPIFGHGVYNTIVITLIYHVYILVQPVNGIKMTVRAQPGHNTFR